MRLTKQRITAFQKTIFDWWKTHKRDLPWRRTHDPYHILVSEVMLQQTQVLRVIPKYAEFIQAYPTIQHLEKASPAAILRMWKGMGYNRRALYLKQTAEIVVRQYGRVFPKTERELVKLPGLGTYTARAILVFAYKQNVAMVDTNIRKIISHYFFKGILQKEAVIQDVADQLVPVGKSWEWHQALMDFGADAMSKVKRPKSTMSKKTIPFKESNRFYRGRIMDLLRDKRYKEAILLRQLAEDYGRPEDFFMTILSGLIHDSLVERSDQFVSLPK